MTQPAEAKESKLAIYRDTPAERFTQINGSCALEGYAPDDQLLSIQKSIIAGEMSVGDAIRGLRASYCLDDDKKPVSKKIAAVSKR